MITAPVKRPWMWATLTLVTLGLAYGVYFDYKRRMDPSFRKRLRKQRKKVEEVVKSNLEASANQPTTSTLPGLDIDAILNQPLPTDPKDREKFFLEQLSKGEMLSNNGPAFYEASAATYYVALKVYPAPAELVILYQKTLDDAIFNLIMGFISSEVKKRQEQYYVTFPPSSMHVKVIEEVDASKPSMESAPKQRYLTVTRDFDLGDVIYTEEPILATLNPEFLRAGTHCNHCCRPITLKASKVHAPSSGSVYCSKVCETEAWETYESLLYADYTKPDGSSTLQLIDEVLEDKSLSLIQIAHFLAFMVYEDMKKSTLPNPEGFGVWDHIERLKYLESTCSEQDKRHMTMLRETLGTKVPGLDEFLNEERYLLLKGKFMYNQFAINQDWSLEEEDVDESEFPDAEEGKEPRRCKSASLVCVGTGLYPVSAYLAHSCAPNVMVTYPANSKTLKLVALQPLKPGDVLRVSYVEPSDRKEVRHERLGKWRYHCTCHVCEEEKNISQAVEGAGSDE